MSYQWMGVSEFFELPKDQRDAIKAWLDDHGLKFVKEWAVTERYLTATKYKVDERGSRYTVNCKGKTRAEDPEHPPHHADDWSCWHAARERVKVPLKSPPPRYNDDTRHLED